MRTKTIKRYLLTRDLDGTLIVWPEEANDFVYLNGDGVWESEESNTITTDTKYDGKPTIKEFTGTEDWSLPIVTKQFIKVTMVSEVSSIEDGDIMSDDSEEN